MTTKSFGEMKLNIFEKIIFNLRFSKVKNFLYPTGVIMDVGCGFRAIFLRLVCRNFKFQKAIGLDVSVSHDIFSEKVLLLQADLNKVLDIESSSIDIVTSLAVLEHLEDPQLNLSEIYRILKPGGRLVLTTPTPLAKYVLEFLAFKLNLINKESIADHKNYFNGKKLREMLKMAGFSSGTLKAKTFTFGMNNIIVCNK